jgi:SAM-dependent methyltransferase
MSLVRSGIRYASNHVTRVAAEDGYVAAIAAGGRLILTEVLKLPKYAVHAARRANHADRVATHPPMYSEEILAALSNVDVEVRPYSVDTAALWAHVAAIGYPRNYAAGPMKDGGAYEQKLVEYFVSLHLLAIKSSDVVIDVASEWSLFPSVARKLTGATVYRQDLIYPPGIAGDRIGGNAAAMSVPADFADKLVLHNSFEHFEGTADIDFIAEAWRVLKPGGMLCIAPINLSDRHCIVTDPLVNRRGIEWDNGAEVIELLWWHNRFGRFYDAPALQRRLLAPAAQVGFETTIYHVINVKDVNPHAYLHFVMIMQKPETHS